MVGANLTVDEVHAPAIQLPHQPRERDLRGIRLPREHRLPEEHAPDGDAVQTTDEPALAPRLDTLNGRTVYIVDCRFDDSDILLKSVQDWFTEHLPEVKTVYKPISSVYTRDDPATWQEIKEKGDAAVIGVGH